MFIYSHNFASEGARALADATGARRIKHERSRFVGSANKLVINWGCSQLPEQVLRCQFLNKPLSVRLAADKLAFFTALEGMDCRTIPWTKDANTVKEWLSNGHTIVARTILNGSSGAGIVMFDAHQPWTDAPLYTQYVKKKDEYRIHVMAGKAISIQKKARRRLAEHEEYEGDQRIRNLANGFVFVRNDINPPADAIKQAISAVTGLGLDFGGVDVIWNENRGLAYVIEVNTACGLEGITVTDYATAIKELYNA